MLPGFIAAGVLDRDGLLVDGLSKDPSFHIENAAATFVTMIHEGDRAGDQMEVGQCLEVQLTYGGTVIMLRSISPDLILGLAASRDSLLGKIRMVMDQLQKRLVRRAPQ